MSKQSIKIPGEVLKNEFLAVYQMTISGLAKEISISTAQLNNVVNNKQKISIPIALRLAKFFGNEPEFWVDLQNSYDLVTIAKDKKLASILKSIKKAQKPKPGSKTELITFKRGRPAGSNSAKKIKKTVVKKTGKDAAKKSVRA
jgi:addiction module HigA family antidote